MIAAQVLVAGFLGLVFGSFANVVAYRVPIRLSLVRRSHCRHCGTQILMRHNIPVLSWLLLRGRCAVCRGPIPVRYPVVEALDGVVFAVLAWFVPAVLGLSGPAAVLAWAAFAAFAVLSTVLALIDLDTRRLPNVIVLTGYGLALGLLGLASAVSGDTGALVRGLAGMVCLYAGYWLIRFVRPDGMGGGDVKLAGLAGLYLGWLGWGALAVGSLAAFVLGGAFAVALVARGRATRRSAFAFGPWLLAGAWVGIWFGNSIWSAYLALFGLVFTKG